MKNKVLMGVSLSVTIFLVLLLCVSGYQEKKSGDSFAAAIEQIRPLEAERSDLYQKIENADREYQENINAQATAQFLFTDLDKEIYTQVFPLMQKKNLTGVLALSPDELPNMDGNIIRREFEEMLNAGWSYCVFWDGSGDLESFLFDVKDAFYLISLTMPKSIYFAPGSYSSEYQEILEEYGFSIAIHHGEEELPIVTTQYSDFWTLGAAALYGGNSEFSLNDVVTSKGNIVVTFSLSDSVPFNAEQFSSYLDTYKSLQDNEELSVTTFNEAYRVHGDADEAQEQYKSDYEEQKKQLDTRVDEIDRQIREIINSVS